jgi:hypothetical protein
MLSRTWFSTMIGAVLLVGACSDSYNPTPSASGVFPAEGFIGRKVRVEISGEETKWADGATVSFGDGITVSNVVVSSESDIFADLDIATTAPLTDHDVTVTSGKETDTLKAAFRLKSPIEFAFQGQGAQGSVAEFTVNNHDFDNPFDTTSTGDGFLTPITYTNITLDGGPGVFLQVSSVTPYSISGVALIDVDAPATTPALEVVSGPVGGTQVTSSLGAGVAIMPRTATALTSDTAATGMATIPFDSGLYSFTPSSLPALTQLSLTSNSQGGNTNFVVLPASGHFADLLTANVVADNEILKTGNLYVIEYDLSGDSAYSYQVLAHGAALTSTAADTEPTNNDSATPTTLTAPALVDNASLTDDTDQDWFQVTVPAGKKIHVVTVGDPGTDTFVDVFGPDNATTQYDQCSDAGYQEDLTTAAVTVAGTYYIEISASQAGYFDPAHNTYSAAVILE